MIVFSLLVSSIVGVFVFHSIKNPHLLQSEEYQLKKEAITIYGSSSYDGSQVVDIIAHKSSTKLLGKEEASD